MVEYIIMAIIAYCIGSLNISIFISKKMYPLDTRLERIAAEETVE